VYNPDILEVKGYMQMSKEYEIITYTDSVAFKYSVNENELKQQIDADLTLVWEEPIENFVEKYGEQKTYKLNSFNNEKEKEKFIDTINDENEKIIDEVEEEISRKMKFSFDYTSPTYED